MDLPHELNIFIMICISNVDMFLLNKVLAHEFEPPHDANTAYEISKRSPRPSHPRVPLRTCARCPACQLPRCLNRCSRGL